MSGCAPKRDGRLLLVEAQFRKEKGDGTAVWTGDYDVCRREIWIWLPTAQIERPNPLPAPRDIGRGGRGNGSMPGWRQTVSRGFRSIRATGW